MLNVTGIEFKFKPIKYAPKYIYFIFSFYIYILFYLHLNGARISNNYHSSYTPVKYLISSTSNNKSDASLSKSLLVAKHFQIQFWDSSPSVNIIRAPAGPHKGPRISVGLISSRIIEKYQGRDYADEGTAVHTVGRKPSIIMRDYRRAFPSVRDVQTGNGGEMVMGN